MGVQAAKFLKNRGALAESEGDHGSWHRAAAGPAPANLASVVVPAAVVELVPESVARQNLVMPLKFDGETVTLAALQPDDIALADRLRFLLAKNVRLVKAWREEIVQAIDRHYSRKHEERALSLLSSFDGTLSIRCASCGTPLKVTRALAGKKVRCPGCGHMNMAPLKQTIAEPDDSDTDLEDAAESPATLHTMACQPLRIGKSVTEFQGYKGGEEDIDALAQHRNQPGFDPTASTGGAGMFLYTVDEGQRVLMKRPNGTMEVIIGPRRLWRGWNTFLPMAHYVAHPDEFLVVRFRNGRQEHLAGPVEVWFDPREHLQVSKEEVLQLSAKEAVVVYSRQEAGTSSPAAATTRRIVHGPALFVPKPGEWLHTFSWHASKGGHKGSAKEPNALVFQKLWLMPDQMYHDVTDVRTADDAVLTIRLMIFFELTDIERMLDATRDPIGDFVNAATSDVVAFTGRHEFEQFKRNTGQLNELEAYQQLSSRAAQCGYRINKVVYRGYGAAESLQQMHDQAIEARTRLQLDRATEQQAQDLENYKLDCQLARAGKRRTEQVQEVNHDLTLARTRQEAELRQRELQLASERESQKLEADLHLAIRKSNDEQQRQHLESLRGLGVDLTAFLTQARADQVIEFRGESRPHVHLDRLMAKAGVDGKTEQGK